MIIYIVKRLILVIPLLFLIIVISFSTLQVMPGDAALLLAGSYYDEESVANIRRNLGLDKPVTEQFFDYVSKVVKGDFGISYNTRSKVVDLIKSRYPITVKLALFGLFISSFFGILSGIFSAVFPNKFWDNIIRILSLAGVSMPAFFVGLILLYFFSLTLGWLPLTGGANLKSLILPAITLSFRALAIIARITRSSMLNILSQDFILMARAQGLSKSEVVFKHALKNVLNMIITIIAVQLGYLLGGAIVTETVFAIPGIGRLIVESILARDIPLMQGLIILIGTVFILLNIIVDILYCYINPKIEY